MRGELLLLLLAALLAAPLSFATLRGSHKQKPTVLFPGQHAPHAPITNSTVYAFYELKEAGEPWSAEKELQTFCDKGPHMAPSAPSKWCPGHHQNTKMPRNAPLGQQI